MDAGLVEMDGVCGFGGAHADLVASYPLNDTLKARRYNGSHLFGMLMLYMWHVRRATDLMLTEQK